MALGGPGLARRKRGSGPLVALPSDVSPPARDAANDAARALGITRSQYIENLILRDREAREATTAKDDGKHSAA